MNSKNKFLLCAPETLAVSWNFINWDKVKQRVRSLQCRIAKAIKQGRRGKAKALQWLLTHSFSAKLFAIKRVTNHIFFETGCLLLTTRMGKVSGWYLQAKPKLFVMLRSKQMQIRILAFGISTLKSGNENGCRVFGESRMPY